MNTSSATNPDPAVSISEAACVGLPPSLGGSLLQYTRQTGRGLEERTGPFWRWIEERRRDRVWPYFRVLEGQVGHRVGVADESGQPLGRCINFGSQDYLGLAQCEQTREAVRAALVDHGVHSAGSPALCGRTRPLLALEARLAERLGREECLVYPTGWAAGFSVLSGLVRREDTLILDDRSHNCLQEGARHATQKVLLFGHNDLDHLEILLTEARRNDARGGLFVVVESLYSMDSDGPDLNRVLALARAHDAICIVDIAHDFGAMGRAGLGLLETVDPGEGPDLIMGSFSKTFAANGGFIACSRSVRTYLGCHSSALAFSNAISPLQTAVVNHTFARVFSDEGQRRRAELARNVGMLRGAMEARGFRVGGQPSPICPVFVGTEPVARLTARGLAARGLIANLVEFPAVGRGLARFRFQVMSTHGEAEIIDAARIVAEVHAEARELVERGGR